MFSKISFSLPALLTWSTDDDPSELVQYALPDNVGLSYLVGCAVCLQHRLMKRREVSITARLAAGSGSWRTRASQELELALERSRRRRRARAVSIFREALAPFFFFAGCTCFVWVRVPSLAESCNEVTPPQAADVLLRSWRSSSI